MGIAPTDAVAGYLDGVAHDEITKWDSKQDDIEYVVYTRTEGATDPAPPGTEDFWVASVSGSGEQALDWTVQSGEWALVIMNADGSPGVSADVRFGFLRPPFLLPVGAASLAIGLVALVGMLVYIWLRFQLPYGIGAVAALFHDVLITLSALALSHREINLPTIAALLTLVGYSVNDTVVVFDRVRENLRLRRGENLEKLMDQSINQIVMQQLAELGIERQGSTE